MEPLGQRLSLLEAQHRVAGMAIAVLAIILCFMAAWRFEDWGQTLGAWWGSLVCEDSRFSGIRYKSITVLWNPVDKW